MTTDKQRTVKKKDEQLYAKKLDNLDKMDKFLETIFQNEIKKNWRIWIETLYLMKLRL